MTGREKILTDAMTSCTGSDFTISGEIHDLSSLFPFDEARRNVVNGLIVVIVSEGEICVKINGKKYTAVRGGLLSVLPFHVLKTVSLSDDFRCAYLSFTFDFMANNPFVLKSDISEKMEHLPCLSLSADEHQRVGEFYSLMLKQYHRLEHPSRVEVVRALLFSFIAEISFIYSKQMLRVNFTRQEQIASDFFRLLHASCKQERHPVFYADRLCMTSKYLSRVLTDLTGHSLYYWISEFSLKEAKILLKSSGMSVTGISEALNYPNSSFFARFFKKCTGMSPLQFRNADREGGYV